MDAPPAKEEPRATLPLTGAVTSDEAAGDQGPAVDVMERIGVKGTLYLIAYRSFSRLRAAIKYSVRAPGERRMGDKVQAKFLP